MESVVGFEWRSAKITLENLDLDLQYNWKEEYSDDITSGCVIRTEPRAGEPLYRGDVVLLVKSKGPEPKPVTVISFLTLSLEQAQEKAAELGLKVGAEQHRYSDAPAGTVIEQSIAAAEVVNTGTEIVFTVSDGAEPMGPDAGEMPPEAP